MFSKHNNGNSASTFRCNKCQAERVKKVVEAKRQRAYDKYGRECSICGYSRCEAALEWHHLNPLEKDIEPRKVFSRNWESVIRELDKCILLCANCHREAHHGF